MPTFDNILIQTDRVPDSLLSGLESRDVVLWIGSLSLEPSLQATQLALLGLPWRAIFCEAYDESLFKVLEDASSFRSVMVSRRGFIQVVDCDPTQIELPQRCLPIYLLNGRSSTPTENFEARLRRMTMLAVLNRAAPREILFIGGDSHLIPNDIKDLWDSGLRCSTTFVSDQPSAAETIEDWLLKRSGSLTATLVTSALEPVLIDIVERYSATYPANRIIARVRSLHGELRRVDLTEAEDPERPLADWYSLIQEQDLALLSAGELKESEFIDFFQDPAQSWRPYAARLPWIPDDTPLKSLMGMLKKLDSSGSDSNSIGYISCESGAGGTTLARYLGWEAARAGYPSLVAKEFPFVPDALPIANFFTRVKATVEGETVQAPVAHSKKVGGHDSDRRYEVPWVVIFDSIHWQGRETELIRFHNELKKSGRPVFLVVVTSPSLGISYYLNPIFRQLAELNHAIESEDALALGTHLNHFLRDYGKVRQPWQWESFYKEHTVRYLEGTAAFWVTLSFWIQGQYDLSESIQSWIYRSFKANTDDVELRTAILRIAALSSERLPLPEALLPPSTTGWPISQRLTDARSSLASLGLVKIVSDGTKYWALVHDILGRFLINALFYDFSTRDSLGYGKAIDAEHLRFLILEQISKDSALGEKAYVPIGEDFATSIFKIDPDHGHGNFVVFWRAVLGALDAMPASLRNTSRLFRHHTAISRRRVAKLDERFYGVGIEEKVSLLNAALDDLNYALNVLVYSPGGETDLNILNSLANAYFDLAEYEFTQGATEARLTELRTLATNATRRAYSENPTSPFVVETYVRNLLQQDPNPTASMVDRCLEALGVLFSVLASNDKAFRIPQLGNLADKALKMLFEQSATGMNSEEPKNAVEILVHAWRALAGPQYALGTALSEISSENRERALEVLKHNVGQGNMQVIRLRYDLTCINEPMAFSTQLDLVGQLEATDYRMPPQLKLEHAILLFQNTRAKEGDRVFFSLRKLWRDNEQFVEVPERLRWLRAPNGRDLQSVHALTGSDFDNRSLATVREFGNALVPFRAEELGLRQLRVGMTFTCHVSFGHNGPFLRPVTAGPTGETGGGLG